MVEPTGVPARMDIRIPSSEQNTDKTAEQTVTDLKLLNTLIADSAGKITSAEMRSDPTRFIARTMITAIIIAISRLYSLVLVPVACANDSSNVTQNILL